MHNMSSASAFGFLKKKANFSRPDSLRENDDSWRGDEAEGK